MTRPADPQVNDVRRGLLVLAVRDTLQKHGIPSGWISAEAHSAMTSSRIRGMHLRLVVREWQPSLLPYSIALQRAITARLMRLDPLAASWLAGVSWRYDVVDDSMCPGLPKVAAWGQSQDQPPATVVSTTGASDPDLSAEDRVLDFRPTVPMSVSPG